MRRDPQADTRRIRQLETLLARQRALTDVERRRADAWQEQAALAWRVQLRMSGHR
jgi:hypothetical protein